MKVIKIVNGVVVYDSKIEQAKKKREKIVDEMIGDLKLKYGKKYISIPTGSKISSTYKRLAEGISMESTARYWADKIF